MLVFEFCFIFIALKLLLEGSILSACWAFFFYILTVIVQKQGSIWSLLLAILVVLIHAHFLATVKEGGESLPPHCWQAWVEYFQNTIPGRVDDMKASGPHLTMREMGARWLHAQGIHPMVGYFLFAKAEEDFFEKSVLSQLGLVHVLTVSGLHIDMIFRALSKKAMTYGSLILFSILVLSYGHMVGNGLPVQRAILMGLMGIWSRYYGFLLSSGFRWQCALIVVLILNPPAFQMSGFYLSFFLSAFIAFTPQSLFSRALFVAVVAVSVWFFHYYPLVGVLMNILALPLYEVLLVLILCVGYVSYVLDMPQPLVLISVVLQGMDQLFLPFVGIMWVVVDHWLIAILFLVAAMVFFCFHRIHLMIIGLMAYLFQVGWMNAVPLGEFKAKFYDVGHGMMVSIQTASHVWVYDVPSTRALRQQLVFDLHRHMPYLQGGVVVSHSDKDHSGGATDLSRLYPQFMRYGNLSVEGKDATCLPGEGWVQDGVTFEWVTTPDLKVSGNAASCVLKVTSMKGFRLLLTGDIEASWGDDYTPSVISLASSPHHGRQEAWFIKRLEGRHTIVSDKKKHQSG